MNLMNFENSSGKYDKNLLLNLKKIRYNNH